MEINAEDFEKARQEFDEEGKEGQLVMMIEQGFLLETIGVVAQMVAPAKVWENLLESYLENCRKAEEGDLEKVEKLSGEMADILKERQERILALVEARIKERFGLLQVEGVENPGA